MLIVLLIVLLTVLIVLANSHSFPESVVSRYLGMAMVPGAHVTAVYRPS